MKLKLENLDVTSFATVAASGAHSAIAASTGGEDCFSWPRICPTWPTRPTD
jgi:hypothetical protein